MRNKRFPLRFKALLMISLPLLGLIVLLNVLSYYVLSQRFSNLEDKTLQQDVQRVLNSLQSQQDYLRATTRDWASWDDTYQFMEDRNQRYLDLNVSPDSFSNLNINLFVLLDTQGQVVLSKQLDLSGQQISSIEADYFEQHPNLINAGDSRQEVDGIALLPTGPMLISARPILTRQGTGPAQGTLVLGRSIDSALVNKLSAALSFDITIRRFNDPDLPADFQSVSQLSAHNVLCQALDQNTIAGYVLIDDIDGHPVLILRVATSRDIHQQGRETITIFATGTVLVGAIFTVLMLVTVERLWVRRLLKLQHNLHHLGEQGNLAARLQFSGDDELSDVAETVNRMLETLEESQNTLLSTQGRFQNVIISINDVVYTAELAPDNTLLSYHLLSPQIETLTGYPLEKFNQDWFFWVSLIYPDDLPLANTYLPQLRMNQTIIIEYRIRKADGSLIWIRDSGHMTEDPDTGRRTHYGVISDITHSKLAAEALRKSEEKFSKAFQATPDGIILTRTSDGLIREVNDSWTRITGYSREDCIGHTTLEINVWGDLNQRDTYRNLLASQGECNDYEIVVRTKDNTIVPGLVSGRMLHIDGEDCILAILRDMTDIKKATAALRDSEEKFSKIFQSSPDAIILTRESDGLIFDMNPAWTRIFGHQYTDTIGRTTVDLGLWISADLRAQHMHLVHTNGEYTWDEIPLGAKDNRVVPCQLSCRLVEINNEKCILSIIRDITDIKKAADALRESEERWQFALEGAGDGVWDWNTESNYVYMSRRWKTMLGYKEHEIDTTLNGWDALVHPDDKPYVYAEIEKHLTGQSPLYSAEYRMRCQDGTYKWILARGKAIQRAADGTPLRLIGTHTDITVRKQTEAVLAYNEELYRVLFEQASDSIFLIQDHRIIECNAKTLEMFGGTRQDVIDKIPYDLSPFTQPDGQNTKEKFFAILSDMRANPESRRFEWQHQRMDGSSFLVEIHLNTLHLSTETFLLAIMRDITEQKQIEAIRLEERNLLRRVLDQIPDPIFLKDTEARLLLSNQTDLRLRGAVNPEAVLGLTDFDFYPPDQAAPYFDDDMQVINTGQPLLNREEIVNSPNGESHWYLTTKVPLQDTNGQIMGMIGINHDITNLKRAEEALRLTQFAVDNAADSVFWITQDGHFIYTNHAASQLSGYSRDELLTMTVFDIKMELSADEWPARWEYVKQRGSLVIEALTRAKDGRLIPVEIADNFMDFGGQEYIFAFARDITERKEAEETLRFTQFAVDNAADSVFWIAQDGHFIYANHAASRLLGYSRDELLAMSVFDIQSNITLEKWPAHWHTIKQSGSLVTETINRTKDGRLIPVEIADNFSVFGGQEYIFAFTRDITERKQAEIALGRINRAYRMLSNCNEAVVRATDEHALLQQVCETIAASEGIRLAWVGYVQHDEAKSVRPIAHAGINDGYTAALKISWDANSPYGYGPNGIAVRSRQPYIIRDTRDGQSEVSWQQDMVKRGYASMATFPLLNDDQVLGTLSVYSEQPDAFDSIEVELLAELAADLAYGIITQRTREERRLAQQAEREQRLLAEALRDTAAVINSSLDPDEVLDHILDHIGHVLPHNQVNIMLLENGIARAVRCRNYASPETEEWVRTTDFDIDQVAGLRLMTQTKEPYIITDNLTPDAWTAFPQTYWVRSYAGAPILLDGEVIGFLNLDSDIPGTFTENHIERLKIFANQAAIAIRNARLFAAEREQRTLAETLRDTAALLTSTLDFDEILDHILNQMGRIVPYEAVSITLVDGEVLRIVRHRGFTERGQGSYVSDLTFDATANPWFDSMQATGQPLFVADVLEDPNWITIEGLNWIRAHLGMPIRVDNKVVGILNLDSSTPGFFTPTHAHQLQILANLVAIAFRNATLFSAERQQRAFTEALHETAILINSTLDFSEVLDRILNNVSKVLTHSTANIMLLDEKDYLHPVGSHGYAERGLLEWFQNVNYPASKVPGMRYMMDTHQPVVYSDIRQHPGWALVEETRWVQSYIGAPILQENEAIGFLNLYSDTPGFFKEADAQRLQGFASQAAVAIRNSQLFMAEREQRNLAEALRDTAAALNRILNFDEVLDYILANVGQVMPHDAANIMLIEHGLARVVRGHGYEQFGVADWVKKLRFIVAEVPVWKDLIATRRPFAVSDTKSNPDWMSEDLPEERWIASTLKVPILLDNELIGILHLDSATTGAFTQKDADRLQAFADQIALAIRNARLFDQVQSYAAELEHRVLVRTAELEAQRAELKTILDSMGEGLIYSAGKRVLYVNQAYTDLLGYSSEAYHIDSDNIYQQIISAVPDYELTMRYIQRAFERRQSWRGEIRVKRADGQDIDVAITLSQVYSPSDEKARGVVVILHDISQEKALRIQKDRFIANASHELRTPLANIKTRLYLLQKQPQKLDSHLEILDRVTNNMSELIENLLDVSRFERGKIPLNRHPIQLQKLVAEVVDIQQAEAERKSVTLDAVLPAEPVYINADSRRLLQVLTNLIVNAISYTPETGQVQVELLTTPPETGHPTGLAVLQVRDTGVGIDPAQLHQVFEPFFRAHEGVSSGTGLGLTIAREITHLHDGEITVESEVGRGSTFTLKLDIHPSPDDNLQ